MLITPHPANGHRSTTAQQDKQIKSSTLQLLIMSLLKVIIYQMISCLPNSSYTMADEELGRSSSSLIA